MADNYETEIEELKKQFFFIMKDALPKMEELTKIVPELRDFASLSQQIGEVTTKVDALGTSVQNCENSIQEINKNFSWMPDVIESLQDRLDVGSRDFTILSSQVADLTKEVQKANENISSMQTDLQSVTSDTEYTKGKVSMMEKDLEDVSTKVLGINASIDFFNEQYSIFQNNFSNINSQMTEINNNISSVQDDVSSLTTKMQECSQNCESVKNTVTNITDVIIPALEAKIESSGGGGEGGSVTENWIPLYDKRSDDAQLNWGHPNGLLGGAGDLSKVSPDFSVYKKLKIYLEAMETRHVIIFDTDIDNDDYQYYAGMVIKQALDVITGISFCLVKRTDGSRYFFMMDFRNIEFKKLNAVPTGGRVNDNEKYFIERIYGLV